MFVHQAERISTPQKKVSFCIYASNGGLLCVVNTYLFSIQQNVQMWMSLKISQDALRIAALTQEWCM